VRAPSAILFDADGVIQFPTANRRAVWTELLGGAEDAVDLFFHDVSAVEKLCYHGEGNFVEGLREVVGRWNCAGSLEDALAAWTAIQVDQEVLRLVASLRASGIACYLATNQEPYRCCHMREMLGYGNVFDRQFYSCEMGFSKPNPNYFRAILDVLNLPPEEVLFLDDNAPNVVAAESVGMRAEVFAPAEGVRPVEEMRRILVRHGLLKISGGQPPALR
jgi:HAD superfamily hydrolase (TIGR01509 family)